MLFVDGNRSLIFGDFGLVERFFFSFFVFYSSSFFLFEHVLSTRENGAEMEISSVVLRRDFNF